MKITEMVREVNIARDNSVKLDVGFTPGRRQANKEARSKLEKEGRPEAADLDIGFGRSMMAMEYLEVIRKLRETEMLLIKFDRKLNKTPCSLEQKNLLKEMVGELGLIKQILVDGGVKPVIVPSKEQVLTTRVISPDRDSRISRKDRTPVSNPRYRRSQCADGWIDHRPQTLVPIGTVLQPLTQKRRIVTRSITSSKKITQDHGTDGGVETKLYKGDILPTSGGGSQVVFNDMECLKPSSLKKRGKCRLNRFPTLTETKRSRATHP